MKSSIAIIAGVLTCASIGAYATETTVEDSGNTVDYVQVRNGVAIRLMRRRHSPGDSPENMILAKTRCK